VEKRVSIEGQTNSTPSFADNQMVATAAYFLRPEVLPGFGIQEIEAQSPCKTAKRALSRPDL
jgi:hypothetical protein